MGRTLVVWGVVGALLGFLLVHLLLLQIAPNLWQETGAESSLQFSALLGLPFGSFLGLFFGFMLGVSRLKG